MVADDTHTEVDIMMLQWGRDLSVAECAVTAYAWDVSEMLQWGRDLSVAECQALAATRTYQA